MLPERTPLDETVFLSLSGYGPQISWGAAFTRHLNKGVPWQTKLAFWW
jgi:hypothetical protein